MNFVEEMAKEVIRERLQVPVKDQAAVLADAQSQVTDGSTLTVAQLMAFDAAFINYGMGQVLSRFKVKK